MATFDKKDTQVDTDSPKLSEKLTSANSAKRNEEIANILKNSKADEKRHYAGSIATMRRNNQESSAYLSEIDRSIAYGNTLMTKLHETSWDNEYTTRISGVAPSVIRSFVSGIGSVTLKVRITNGVAGVVAPLGQVIAAIVTDHEAFVAELHKHSIQVQRRLYDVMVDSASNGDSGKNAGVLLAVRNFAKAPVFNKISITLASVASVMGRMLFGKKETYDQKILGAIKEQTEFLRTGSILSKEHGFFGKVIRGQTVSAITSLAKESVLMMGGMTKQSAQDAENKRADGQTLTLVEKINRSLFSKNIDLMGYRGSSAVSPDGSTSSSDGSLSSNLITIAADRSSVINITHYGELNVKKSGGRQSRTFSGDEGSYGENVEHKPIRGMVEYQSSTGSIMDGWINALKDVGEGVAVASKTTNDRQKQKDYAAGKLIAEFNERTYNFYEKFDDFRGDNKKSLKKVVHEQKRTNRTLTLQLFKSLFGVVTGAVAALGGLVSAIVAGLASGSLLTGLLKKGKDAVAGAGGMVRSGAEKVGSVAKGALGGTKSALRSAAIRFGKRNSIFAAGFGLYEGYKDYKNAEDQEGRFSAVGKGVGVTGGIIGGGIAGSALGAKLGMAFGPMGAAAGGVIGGLLGSFAGSEMGGIVGASLGRGLSALKDEADHMFKLFKGELPYQIEAREEKEKQAKMFRNMTPEQRRNIYRQENPENGIDLFNPSNRQSRMGNSSSDFSNRVQSGFEDPSLSDRVRNFTTNAVDTVTGKKDKDSETLEGIRVLMEKLLDETQSQAPKTRPITPTPGGNSPIPQSGFDVITGININSDPLMNF